ncbi:MAG: DUF1232 domain-containing protein [Oscillospiraceae bacterium]|nr:DUF1232 domain-containing protein [Oscillospiraceae bacterium]
MSKFRDTTSVINQKIGAIFIAMKRSDTPLYAKLASGLCVYYVLSPLDLVPDFIPVLGAVDDFLVLPFLMWLAVKLIPADIMEECLAEVGEIWQHGGKTKKRYAIPVLTVWLLLAMWLWYIISKYIL